MRRLAHDKFCIMCCAWGFAVLALLPCLFASGVAPTDRRPPLWDIGPETVTQSMTEERLVSDNVRCIYASHGIVWIGTDRGVSVFHSADDRWTKLDREDGLISDDVTDIAVDGVNAWIGTHIGLSHYNAETKKWRKFQTRDGLTHNHVNTLAIDGHYVWTGTENGISRYDTLTGAWASQVERDGDGLNVVTAIAVNTEYVWFCTEGGLRRYDKAKDAWNTYTEEEGLVDNRVVCIALSPDEVWVGTEKSGVSRFSIANQAFTHSHDKTTVMESDYIRAIIIDGDNVWFGSADRGIRRYLSTVDTWLKYTAEEQLISDHITDLISNGRYIWIGTAEGGLGRFDKSSTSWRWYSRTDRLASSQIHDLAWSGSTLWVGTNRGLSRYEPINESWTTYTKADGLVTNYITSVAVSRTSDRRWVGTPLGLGMIRDNRWWFFTRRDGLSNDFVTNVSIAEEQVWAATRSGLNVLSLTPDDQQPLVKSYLENHWVTSTLRLGKDFWAGTAEGLYRKSLETDSYEPYLTIGDYVNTLAQGSGGELLVGTRNGLWIIKDGTSFHITEGLPNPNVRAIAAVDGVMLVGTPGGVSRFGENLKVEQLLTMESEGLLHDNVRNIVLGGDQVFFGTDAGLAVLDRLTGRWIHHKPYRSVDILREYDIRWMEQDGPHFWILNWSVSPNGAILRFDRRTDTWMTYTKESLPLSETSSLITDVPRIAVEEEDVWITTDSGILKYNKQSDTWKHLPLDRRAEHVAIDRFGRIWISLRGGGGAHYDEQTGQWETFSVVEPGDGGRVESVACTNNGVWFGTGAHGIRRYDWRTRTWTAYTEAQGLASREAAWLVANGAEVWTGGGNAYSWISGRELHGVSRYRAEQDMWTIYNERMGLRAARPISGHSDERYIWSYGWNGIDRFDRTTETWTSFTGADGLTGWGGVQAVAGDGDTFWVGTNENGALRHFEASGAWLAYGIEDGLASNEIRNYGIKVDPEHVWVGTAEGLSRYDKMEDTWTSFVKQETLASRRVAAVAVDERYVWAGTQRGLSRYDKKYDTWRHFEKEMKDDENDEDAAGESEGEAEEEKEEKISELVDNNVVDLSVGKRYVWIATEGGVGRYDKIADRFDAYTEENHLPSVDIRAIGESRTDVWVGTKNGVSKHNILSDDPNAWETYNAAIEITPTVAQKYTKSLENDDVRCLAVDDNRIWIGTKTGVSVHDFSERTWETFTRRDGLASHEVSCIGIDETRIWFGSGHGATVYDTAEGSWRVYSKRDGLGSDLITAIAINDKEIWLGTFDNGVTVLTKATGEFSVLTMADGLPHNGILSLALDGEFVWIGTHGGLARCDTVTRTWTVFTEHFDHDGI